MTGLYVAYALFSVLADDFWWTSKTRNVKGNRVITKNTKGFLQYQDMR